MLLSVLSVSWIACYNYLCLQLEKNRDFHEKRKKKIEGGIWSEGFLAHAQLFCPRRESVERLRMLKFMC